MIGLRSVLPNAKLINFEDDGEGILKADLVFNALYSEHALPNVYGGEKYYICGKIFMFYEPIKIKEDVNRVFIAFGADPQNYTDRLLDIISKDEYKKYEFVVVVGRAKYNVDALLEYNKYEHIQVLYDVSNMPELMSSCDIAITSVDAQVTSLHSLAFLQSQWHKISVRRSMALFAMRMVSRTLVLTQAMKLSKVFSKCI